MAQLNQLLQEIRNELGPEFIATDIVGMDGLSIAGYNANSEFDTSALAARFAMVMKLAEKVANKVQVGAVEDGLVTTENLYILTRFLGDGSYYWALAVTRDATLGMVRMLMNEYQERLWRAIPR